MIDPVLLAGPIFMVYLLLIAAAMGTFPSLLVSYSVALLRWRDREVLERILFQLGVLGLTFVATTALVFGLLFAFFDWRSMDVRVFGVELSQSMLFVVPLVGCLPAVVVGEVAMAWASSRSARHPEDTSRPWLIAGGFGFLCLLPCVCVGASALVSELYEPSRVAPAEPSGRERAPRSYTGPPGDPVCVRAAQCCRAYTATVAPGMHATACDAYHSMRRARECGSATEGYRQTLTSAGRPIPDECR